MTRMGIQSWWEITKAGLKQSIEVQAHAVEKAVGFGLEVVQQRLIIPFTNGSVEPETNTLGCDPSMSCRWGLIFGVGRTAEIRGQLHELELAVPFLVLGERSVHFLVEDKDPTHVRKDSLVEVHPHSGGGDSRHISRIVEKALRHPRPIGGNEGRHASVSSRS